MGWVGERLGRWRAQTRPCATGELAGVERVGAPDVADTFKTTYLSRQDLQMTKPIDALKTVARYVEARKPKTLAEAEHMLDLISVMADETILDEGVAESSRRPAAYTIDANSIVSFHADSLAIAGPPPKT